MMELLSSLLPWQKLAVDKLLHLRVGALYMEMGTGKTRTALELVKRRIDAGKLDMVLWLCPCSVQSTIKAEIDKHAVGADMIRIRGIESLSASKRLYGELLGYVSGKNVMLIVDESNLVKNHRAIRSQRVISIAEQCKYRIILNGTPLSKNEKDLYAQWYLLDWRILGYQSFWSFAANHLEYDQKNPGRIRRVLNVDYLTDKIAPYSYMIKKDECLNLPCKRYFTEYFSLTHEQREHYTAVKEAYLIALLECGDESSAAIYRVFTALQNVTSGCRITTLHDTSLPIMHEPMFAPADNPRIKALLEQVEKISGQAVIWCKYTSEIRDICAVLDEQYGHGSSVPFYGALSRKKRVEALAKFSDGARFFVANKTCAGYGLNLQFCHVAIYYNNDWDWATRAQSEDRLHRIGQTSEITICDICASETIDDRIISCIKRKENMVEGFKREMVKKNLMEWIDGGNEHDKVRVDK